MLKNILENRYLIKKGLHWILGNYKSVNFWHDTRMEESSLIDKMSQELSWNVMKNIMVSYFIENGTWNRDKLRGYLPSYIVDKIMNIHIAVDNIQDNIILNFYLMWIFCKNSHLVEMIKFFSNHLVNYLWRSELIPKLKLFAWELITRKILVKENLSKI